MPNEEAERPEKIDPPDDLDWLRPPKNVLDEAAWDRFWKNQVDHKVAGFHDMFLRDESLARLMIALGMRTVLCAGNGISIEPHVLAYAGFAVTAADLSVWATECGQNWRPQSKFLKGSLYGHISFRPFWLSPSYAVRKLGWLISDINKHLFNRVRRKGGTLKFLAGDLLNPEFCPGPFDAVVERRTVQLYSGAERDRILERLAARLAPQGIFVSHCHLGWWRPGEPRIHPFKQWFQENGFTIIPPRADNAAVPTTSGRTAMLSISTG